MKTFYNFALVLSIIAISIVSSQSSLNAQNHHEHYKCSRQQVDNNKTPSPAPANITNDSERTKSYAQKMTFYNWYSYTGSALVKKLKSSIDYPNQLKSLYDFDERYGKNIFSSRNIEAVAHEMYNISIAHTGDYSSGMYGLVVYLHAATYHEFFKESVSIDTEAMRWYVLACESFTQNANLYNTTKEAISILDEFLIMVDNNNIRNKPRIISMIKNVMSNLVQSKNWKQISNDRVLRSYATMANRVFFYMFRGIQNSTDTSFCETIKNDPNFFNLAAQIATSEEIKTNDEFNFLQNNAIGELARAASKEVLVPLVEGHLANISTKYKRLDVNWLKCIEALNKYCNCSKYNLCNDLVALRKEINQKLFPNTWTFDNGKLIIKTPLSYKQVEPLYYAAKEVEAQMYRILQSDKAVDNDPNKTLNMVVYGTLADYKAYQTFLNNLSTDNGGMYIEKGATFYTYERTSQESIYSLEELFRHEYTHYLQGRYIENGFWGSTDFFKDSRLTWFEEGMAEFMAGSTSSDGILFRNSMMRSIESDGDDRMPVKETIGASYSSGFKFYRYSYLIWQYLYHEQYQTIKELMMLIKNDDISGFDTKINSIKQSASFQEKINNFTDKWVNTSEQWWTPTTAYLPDNILSIKKLTNIEKEFKEITGLDNIEVVSDASSSISRFGIKGKLTTGKFDTELNSIIKTLNDNKYINNFDYLVGYYKNVSQNNADFYITGSLQDANTDNTPVCDFTINTISGMIGQEVIVTSTSSGYIKKFRWIAENATIIDETKNQTKIIFPTAGKHNISLEITGNDANIYIKTINNAVEIFKPSSLSYCIPETKTNYAYIQYVEISNMTNDNLKFNTNGYVFFSDKIAILEKAKENNIIIKNSYSSDKCITKVWIDWNQNGIFDNTEKMLDNIGDKIITSSISAPQDAIAGITRMRVRYTLNKDLDACETNTYIGETHDYNIIVKNTIIDNEKPSSPIDLKITDIKHNSALIKWTSSTDNIAISNYNIYANNKLIGSSNINSYKIENLEENTNYDIHIIAYDTSNNESNISSTLNFTTSILKDEIPPTAPSLLFANEIAQTSIKLNWDASNDNVAVNTYNIYMNNINIANTKNTNYIISNLNTDTEYNFFIKASDTSNNISEQSNTISVITLKEKDTTPPTIPQALSVINTTESSIEINWQASTDNIEIKEYLIFLDNELYKHTNNTYNTIRELLANTSYEIKIKAVDTNNNESDFSDTLIVETLDNNNTYCNVISKSNVYEWISSVSMKNLHNKSSKQEYSDFTNINSYVEAGTRTWITIELGFIQGQAYEENLIAWVDWNKDNTFDESEIIIRQTRNSIMGAWFDVPMTFSGSTRMRIMLQYNIQPEACTDITSGEIEDYTITTDRTKQGVNKTINKISNTHDISLTVYPNPCSDILNIEIPEEFSQGDISIINPLGVIVKQSKIDYLRKQINVSNVPKGKYVILITKDKKTISKHVIIN